MFENNKGLGLEIKVVYKFSIDPSVKHLRIKA